MQMEDPQNQQIMTVTELTTAIKNVLEPAFTSISLQGEVSNYKRQSSGHLYFSLKDANAQISAVMFRGNAAALRTPFKDGDQVMVRGEISLYAPRGSYQLVVRELQPMGMGELLMRLEILKREIHRRGWFKQEHKKPIPHLPERIGVITSPTGAVIQDILNVLTRRVFNFHLILNPVRVQGEGAAGEIAQAIIDCNRYDLADVIILGRGGGSIEDLWAFNEEIVAKAIFESKIPIICAVGHETDHCIAEYVADLRAPTPSAAAEMVMKERSEQASRLALIDKRLKQTVQHLIKHGRERLRNLKRHPLMARSDNLLGPHFQRIDHLRSDLDQALKIFINQKKVAIEHFRRQASLLQPQQKISHLRQKFQDRCLRLQERMHHLLERKKEKLLSLEQALALVNPKKLLENGYSILFDQKSGSVIKSVRALKKNQPVRILLSDGEVEAAVTTTKEN